VKHLLNESSTTAEAASMRTLSMDSMSVSRLWLWACGKAVRASARTRTREGVSRGEAACAAAAEASPREKWRLGVWCGGGGRPGCGAVKCAGAAALLGIHP
jgi:hypothetical protein